MLVVLVVGQLPRAYRGVERVLNEMRVSQVGGQVVCGGESWGVGGRVALWRLGGDHHPADPCGVLQHLQRTRPEKGYKSRRFRGNQRRPQAILFPFATGGFAKLS